MCGRSQPFHNPTDRALWNRPSTEPQRAASLEGSVQNARTGPGFLCNCKVDAAPAIPWLDTTFGIGDRIAGVRGQEISLAATIGASARYPSVVGKRYRLANGRYETELLLERTEVSV